MARIKESHDIKIKRNIIERFLMNLKEFAKKNRKGVLSAVLSVLLVLIALIAISVYYENTVEQDLIVYEKISEKYSTYLQGGNDEDLKAIISDLSIFVESASYGYPAEMSNYLLGNIYYDEKEYEKASVLLINFANDTSNSTFHDIALLKAAISYEELGKLDESFNVLERLKENSEESVIPDQIYYNLGRIYAEKGDLFNSKEYFNKVISQYSQSPYAAMAKKRLFLLGMNKK